MEKESYRKPSNVIAISSAVIALISMLVAIKSCQISRQCASLDYLQHALDRVAEYDGVIQPDGSIKVYPVNPNHNIQEITVYLPKLFSEEPLQILPPDFILPITWLKYPLQEFLDKRFFSEKDSSIVCLDARIPLVLESIYTVKGKHYVDQSLYQIRYTFAVHDTGRLPDINITDLGKLHGPLKNNQNPQLLISKLWQDAELQAEEATDK